MKVSLNTVKQWLDFELPPVNKLVDRINRQLGGVEEVIDLGARYMGIVVVRVVSAERLANSDHLHICMVDDGGVTSDVERDESGLVQVLTGAPNVHAGMLAVWLPPGATVPDSFATEPFVLASRKMLGTMSHGMLASQRELAIGDEHDGILEIDPNEVTIKGQLVPGANFAQLFGLDDTIIDIENKMFTHRPDLFGQLGVAREIAGIFGRRFESPDWYLRPLLLLKPMGQDLAFKVTNSVLDKSPRIMALAMDNVTVGPSPLWLKCALAAMGSKSINNVVDATNYVMLVTAQPTHAYDYDKLAGHEINVRMARNGEKISLLNGKTYELVDEDIVIADAYGVVGLAGVMGGLDSEVTASTKRIVLEVASFDMYSVRRTSMRYGLFTEALTRFNKGQSSLQNPAVIAWLAQMLTTNTGASAASQIHDIHGDLPALSTVDTGSRYVNDRLGLKLDAAAIVELLGNVEFEAADKPAEQLDITVPFWRTDIEQPEDIVEEVGRLFGYDQLPRELPLGSIRPAAVNSNMALQSSLRHQLARLGANEVLTHSFIDARLLEASNQDESLAYELSNALSPDLRYYRTSLLPSLLDHVHTNVKAGFDRFALFEIGKTHILGDLDEGLPDEYRDLALVVVGDSGAVRPGSAYYVARSYLAGIVDIDRIQLVLVADETSDTKRFQQMAACLEPQRSAWIKLDGQILGAIGEYNTVVTKKLKLPQTTAGFEISIDLVDAARREIKYTPLSRFPSVTQDATLRVGTGVTFGQIYQVCINYLEQGFHDGYQYSLSPLAVYQDSDTPDFKNISLRLEVANMTRTLTAVEVDKTLDDMTSAVASRIGAERV